MGLAITLLLAFAMATMAFVARDGVIYVILALFTFFAEQGGGFTSYSGSFLFNQNFVKFGHLRAIEFIVLAIWASLLISRKRVRISGLGFEGKLLAASILWLLGLLFLEYFLHGAVTISDWRLIVSGVMLFHILAMLIDSEQKLVTVVTVFVILLAIRAALGLAVYLAGHGVMSPRGQVPFFWDSEQVSAFGFGAVLLAAYLSNYRLLRREDRRLAPFWAMVMFGVLSLTVLLSIRRSLWIETLGGIGLVLLAAKRVRLPHYLGLSFAVVIGMVLVLSLPGLGHFREKYGQYIESVDLFNHRVASSYENKVHINNVQQYTKMILDNPSVLLLGFRGYPGRNYDRLPKLYSNKMPLGVAHNAILRTIYFFGIGGLFIFLAFYWHLFMLRSRIRRTLDDRFAKAAAIAGLSYLFMQFVIALTLVPPFYTSSKGLFYTFLAAVIVRAGTPYAFTNPRPAKGRAIATARRRNSV